MEIVSGTWCMTVQSSSRINRQSHFKLQWMFHNPWLITDQFRKNYFNPSRIRRSFDLQSLGGYSSRWCWLTCSQFNMPSTDIMHHFLGVKVAAEYGRSIWLLWDLRGLYRLSMFATTLVLSLPSGTFSSVTPIQDVLIKIKRKGRKEKDKELWIMTFPLQVIWLTYDHSQPLSLFAYRHFLCTLVFCFFLPFPPNIITPIISSWFTHLQCWHTMHWIYRNCFFTFLFFSSSFLYFASGAEDLKVSHNGSCPLAGRLSIDTL